MASKKLHEHSLYERLFENAYSIMLILNPDTGEILDANKAAVKFYQYSKQELLEMNISQLNTLSEKQISKEMNKAKLQKRNYFNFTHRLKNGEIRKVEAYTSPIEIANQKVLCSIIHDISQRKIDEEKLRKSESTIRAMINATSSMVYLIDLQGIIIDMNPQGARRLSKTPAQLIGEKINLIFPEDEHDLIISMSNRVVETQDSLNYQKNRDGRYYDITFYPVFNKKKEVDRICIFTRDITDLKMTEKVLAAVETAGGVCHEMNQPLQVILGNLELLRLNLEKDDPNQKFIDVLMNQTERLGIITKKLAHITRYETKEYIKGTIFDINRSSEIE